MLSQGITPKLTDVLPYVVNNGQMPYSANLRLTSSEVQDSVSTPDWEKIKKCEKKGLSIEDDKIEFSADCANVPENGPPCDKFPDECQSICTNGTSQSHEGEVFHIRFDMDANVLKCHILNLARTEYPIRYHFVHDNPSFQRFCVYIKYIRFLSLVLSCDLDKDSIELLTKECRHIPRMSTISLHESNVKQSNLQYFIDNFTSENTRLDINSSYSNDYIKQMYGLNSLKNIRNIQLTFKNLEYDILKTCNERVKQVNLTIIDPLTQNECKNLLHFFQSRIWYMNRSLVYFRCSIELSQFKSFMESFITPFNHLYVKTNKDKRNFLMYIKIIYTRRNDDLLKALQNEFGNQWRRDHWYVRVDFDKH